MPQQSRLSRHAARWVGHVIVAALTFVLALHDPAWAAGPVRAAAPGPAHLVLAHYLPFFARTINNKPAARDSYAANLMQPGGDGGKWSANGGFVRSRPLPLPLLPIPADNWKQKSMEAEVRDAMSRGIDGFSFDFGPGSGAPGTALSTMLTAAKAVSANFKIALVPDMMQFTGTDSAQAVHDAIAAVARDPALLRLSDGRLVVMPFAAETQPAEWWAALLAQLQREQIAVAFVPLFLGPAESKISAFEAISVGVADWGAHEVTSANAERRYAQIAHAHGKFYVQSVVPQDYRPKGFRYWEAGNSAAFRTGWMSAIQGPADWVQLVTWNDYSESTQIEPSTNLEGDEGSGYFDLNSYYATWFKSGSAPAITCDVLYYFFRRERTDAPAPAQTQPTLPGPYASDPPDNEIELLSFLTAPAMVQIAVGDRTFQARAPQGINSFKVPLTPGQPRFRLLRDGNPLIDVTAHARIVPQLSDGTLDLTYQSGSAPAPHCSAAIR